MKKSINAEWQGNMAFDVTMGNHTIKLDADAMVGGEDLGVRPKALMMVALAGCTGMDVVSILRKMRVEFEDFNVKVEGDLTEEHPKQFKTMKVIYEFWGDNLPMDKLEKAVNLSETKYCGVRASYDKAFEVSSEIVVH